MFDVFLVIDRMNFLLILFFFGGEVIMCDYENKLNCKCGIVMWENFVLYFGG